MSAEREPPGAIDDERSIDDDGSVDDEPSLDETSVDGPMLDVAATGTGAPRPVAHSSPASAKRAARRAARLAKRAERAIARKTLWEDAKNLPNLLTFGRIVMIPAVLVLLGRGTPRDCFWAAIVYGLAAITDALDGWLARRQGLESVLGKFLDPLADKLIVAATLVWLVPMGRIAPWAVALLISRELSITALRSIASSEGLVMAAGEGGKAKTALQMIGILCLILGYPYRIHTGIYDFGVVDLVPVGRLLVYSSLVFSLTSAAQYVGWFVAAIEKKSGSRSRKA